MATAQLTTLKTVRLTNFGGPYPGMVPGRGLFPGHTGSEPAAWCWTAKAARSGDASGPYWSLRVAVRGAQSKQLFGMGGGGPAPTGPVTVP